jgi:hypothetical protein
LERWGAPSVFAADVLSSVETVRDPIIAPARSLMSHSMRSRDAFSRR